MAPVVSGGESAASVSFAAAGAPESWTVVHQTGSVEDLHHLPDPESLSRTVRVLEPTRPAIVLGSSQSESIVDHPAAASHGFDIVRRRSGGGAVLVIPGEQVWLDLLIPAADPLWNDDIVKAAGWVGAAWAEALSTVGVDGAAVHSGRLVTTRWSSLVCFAGLGPGEVTVGGMKVMGLSQRRGRHWTRIQSAVHLRWRPDALLGCLDMSPERRSECLADVIDSVVCVDASPHSLTGALLASLPD